MRKMETYRRNEPDTVAGESIQITTTFSSFYGSEINEIEEWCKKNIGYARVSEVEINQLGFNDAEEK